MKEDPEIEACKFLDDARVASACHRLPLLPRATFQVHEVKEIEKSLLHVEDLHGKNSGMKKREMKKRIKSKQELFVIEVPSPVRASLSFSYKQKLFS